MVKSIVAGLLLALAAGQAAAQAVDWRGAGGDLFAGAAVDVAGSPNPASPPPRLEPLSQPFMEAIAAAARRHGLDEKLLHALVIVESGYRPDAVSTAGAGGLTQLMPGTAAALGVRDRFDPEQNLSGGADYLARQLLRFGDLRLALAAYNAGPARVARLGRIPEIAETRAYVTSVVDCFLALSAGRGPKTSRDCRPMEHAR
jgi:soluble lytic murein transglycosylase-like protein